MFANENGPGVGVIDRITVDSYLDVSGELHSRLPPAVRQRRPAAVSVLVGGSGYSVKIGPFPKGMPVGLITNMDLARLRPVERQSARSTRKKACSRC